MAHVGTYPTTFTIHHKDQKVATITVDLPINAVTEGNTVNLSLDTTRIADALTNFAATLEANA